MAALKQEVAELGVRITGIMRISIEARTTHMEELVDLRERVGRIEAEIERLRGPG